MASGRAVRRNRAHDPMMSCAVGTVTSATHSLMIGQKITFPGAGKVPT